MKLTHKNCQTYHYYDNELLHEFNQPNIDYNQLNFLEGYAAAIPIRTHVWDLIKKICQFALSCRADSFACPYPPCKFITAQLRYMVRHVDNVHKGSPTKGGEVPSFYCCDCSFRSNSQVRFMNSPVPPLSQNARRDAQFRMIILCCVVY